MNYKISIDPGKYALKAISKDLHGNKHRIKFRSKMNLTKELSVSSKPGEEADTYVISYDNRNYLIGKKAEIINYEKNKGILIHKLAMYTAISQLVPNDSIVELAVGCPIDTFNNYTERMNYRNYLLEDKDVKIRINNKPYNFTIDKISIYPESAGRVLKNFAKYENRILAVIDIGGLNVNACVYSEGDILTETCFTINKGSNVFLNELRLALNKEFAANIQEWQMEMVYKDGFIRKHPHKSKEFIEDFTIDYIDEILRETQKRNWDLDNIDVAFTGGGSILFEDLIVKKIPHAEITKDGVWDNAEGMAFVLGI